MTEQRRPDGWEQRPLVRRARILLATAAMVGLIASCTSKPNDSEVLLHSVELGRAEGLQVAAYVVSPNAATGSHGGTGYGLAQDQLALLGADRVTELPSTVGVPLPPREPVFDGFESSLALEISLEDAAALGRASSLLIDYSVDGEHRSLEVPTIFLACKLTTDSDGQPASGLETPSCRAEQKAAEELKAEVPRQRRLEEVA